MTLLLVIRHGETEWNAAGLMQGRADIPMSSAGRERLRAAKLPPGWNGVLCLSSPLSRAMETAQLLGLDPQPEPRLIEMDWGKWEGRSLAELRAELGEAMEKNEARGLDFRPAGGESPREVQKRMKPLLAGLAAPTVAVTHKGVLRALYALTTGWSMTGKPPHKLIDRCAHVFDVADGTPSVAELNIPLERAP
ncbi:MAG: histidine phosphatase family protein [Propylenella sp.]